MFPILPLEAWAVLHGILGFVVCIIGRYKLFERIMEVFVALMFITVVGLAILLAPNLGELASGVVPTRFPEGSLLFILSLIGGWERPLLWPPTTTGCVSVAGVLLPGSR